jgi:hypothetical protein
MRAIDFDKGLVTRLVLEIPIFWRNEIINKLRGITRMKLNRIFLSLVAFFPPCLQVGRALGPAPVTLVKAGRLLEPRTGNVLSPAAVLI